MTERWRLIQGDVLDALPDLAPESFDAVLCDPPYGLKFMGKAWDHGVPGEPVWRLVLDALKPGAHMFAFGGTRTYHRLVCAIEDAGFIIRDKVSWFYGTGFPKSCNFGRALGGEWEGYGTGLKPAVEDCALAMKPCAGTYAANAAEYGVAGLNVDGGRVGTERVHTVHTKWNGASGWGGNSASGSKSMHTGRWPANLILDAEAGAMLDAQSGITKERGAFTIRRGKRTNCVYGGQPNAEGTISHAPGDTGGASRFFYCPKVSRAERNAGLDDAANRHPTLKPIDLCRYLATLLLPPKRDTPRRILVPFSGSGSEMIGALLAGWDEVVGIEREAEYIEIAQRRLAHWCSSEEEPDTLFAESA